MTIKVFFSANPMEHPVYAEVVYKRDGGNATNRVLDGKEFSGKTLRAVLRKIALWWSEVEAA